MSDEILGQDISLQDGVDLKFSANQDFDIVIGRNNLKQAIFTRLSTIKGEYYVEEYGSELYTTIGYPKDDILKNRISGYIVEALNQEPRISEILSITVTFPDDEETDVLVELSVLPIDSQVPLNLVYPYFV